MEDVATTGAQSETQFAELVDALAADPDRREQLTDLLREDHPLYNQRGTATTIRMRGWVLLAFARSGVSDAALIYVLEELDTGVDAYLVAAAARALRSYPRPTEALAPFVMRALANIRYRDEDGKIKFVHTLNNTAIASPRILQDGRSPIRATRRGRRGGPAWRARLGPRSRSKRQPRPLRHAARFRIAWRIPCRSRLSSPAHAIHATS